MGSPICLADLDATFVADASTVINLNATGCAQTILTAVPNRVVVVDVVLAELEEGHARGRTDGNLLRELAAGRLVEIVTLSEPALRHFEELVIGPAAMTLDDGEAATIAYAVGHDAVAILDERKATRLCAERFSRVPLGCTVDILAHPEILKRFGREGLADTVFNALHRGRMRVPARHIDWVLQLIGSERAALCTSIPRSLRQAFVNDVSAGLPSIDTAPEPGPSRRR